jgi:hypothetical protein
LIHQTSLANTTVPQDDDLHDECLLSAESQNGCFSRNWEH